MDTTTSRIAIHSDVVFTELQNGDTVLLHLTTQQYYTLNETGAHIWHLLSEGLTPDEISQQIEATYEITMDKAQQCVVDLVNELVAEKLIWPSSD